MSKYLYIAIGILFSVNAFGQVPQVSNIEKVVTWPGDTLTITGNNFSTNPADLQVWFGAVAGSIVSSTNTVIEVVVPEEADFEKISIINLSTGLIGGSSKKFYTSFSGEEIFDVSAFSAPVSFDAVAGEDDFYDLCACDFNLDGKPDIAATKEDKATDMIILENGSSIQNLSFSLLSKNELANLEVGAPTLNAVCGDLNGDGKPELVASRSGSTRNNIFVLQNTSSGGNIAFAPKSTLFLEAGVIARRIKLEDLNFDGKPEIVVTNSNNNTLFIYRNTSTKTTVSFSTSPVVLAVTGAQNLSGLEVVDLDGDRLPDIVVAQFFKDNLYIMRNTSSSTSISFSGPITLTAVGNPLLNVKAGDLNNDGLPELVATNTSSNQILIFPNQSSSGINFGAPEPFTTGNGPWGIDMADMNGDKRLDIVIGNQNQQQISVLINQSTTSAFSFAKNDITTALNVRNIVANDFDGDGKPDIAFVSFQSGSTTGPFRVEVIRNLNCFVPRILNEENLAICPGQTIRLKSVPNVAATFNWYQNGNATPLKSGPDNFLNITSSGTYTVEAVTEGGACQISVDYTVLDGTGTVPGDPVPSSNTPVCEGEEIQLTVQDITNATYEWTGPNNFTSIERAPVITGANTEMAGVYSVRIKIGDCLSSESSTTVEVVSLPVFTISAQSALTFCEGTTNTLSVTSRTGYSYQWFKDGASVSGATSTTFNATASGAYSVLVTDNANGCTLTTNGIELNVLTAPTADFTLSQSTACVGEEITITNNSTIDPDATVVYSWTFGNGSTSSEASPAINYTTAGNYTVALTINYQGVSGCSATISQTVTVTDATPPAISATATEICPGEPVDLSLTNTFQEVTWSTGQSGNTITVDQPGTFSVNTVDTNGCPGSDEIIITSKVVPDIEAEANRTTITAGDTTQLRALSANAISFNWKPADLLDNATAQDPVAQPTSDTTFVVVASSADGCTDSASVKILVDTGSGLNISPKKAFSPESTINPTWEIDLGFIAETCNLTIFDDRGMKILEESGNFFSWNATYNGNPLPEGVYYYVVGCPTEGQKAGTVLVVRR
ncbi:MAG: FG-GAP-like repeat-containing protein [Candidatus Cyclobacteriaceae bacterium M2_1C_046]